MISRWSSHSAEVVGLTYGIELLRQEIEAEIGYAAVYRHGAFAQETSPIAVGMSAELIRPLDLKHWVTDQGCALEFLAHSAPEGQVVRPIELAGHSAVVRGALFRRINRVRSVGDALSAVLPREDDCRLVLVFFRWSSRPRFSHAEEQMFSEGLSCLKQLIQGQEAQVNGLERNGSDVELAEDFSQLLTKLSRTEQKVLHYLKKSLTEKQIAEEISRSPHTVHVHVKSIYLKLGVSSRKELFSRIG